MAFSGVIHAHGGRGIDRDRVSVNAGALDKIARDATGR
jgi:hypothetical protein